MAIEIDAMIGELSHLMAEIKEGKPLRLVGQASHDAAGRHRHRARRRRTFDLTMN